MVGVHGPQVQPTDSVDDVVSFFRCSLTAEVQPQLEEIPGFAVLSPRRVLEGRPSTLLLVIGHDAVLEERFVQALLVQCQ